MSIIDQIVRQAQAAKFGRVNPVPRAYAAPIHIRRGHPSPVPPTPAPIVKDCPPCHCPGGGPDPRVPPMPSPYPLPPYVGGSGDIDPIQPVPNPVRLPPPVPPLPPGPIPNIIPPIKNDGTPSDSGPTKALPTAGNLAMPVATKTGVTL